MSAGPVARVAYVVLAHRGPAQVARLVRRLAVPGVAVYVHVDRNADDAVYEELRRDLGETARWTRRRSCTWGGFGIVAAALEGLRAAAADGPPGHVVLLSGQDYPLRPPQLIVDDLAAQPRSSFLDHFAVPTDNWAGGGMERMTGWHWHGRVLGRQTMFPHPRLPWLRTWHRRFPAGFAPYGGSMYWALSREALEYVLAFVSENRAFVRYFRHVNIPDESFFHTILLNSPLREHVVNDDLHYADWGDRASHPKTLGLDDLDAAFASGKPFARKFDDARVLDAIDGRIG